MKTQLSSLEIAALINEFQFLLDSKVDQVYQPEKKQFLLSLHLPGQSKYLLKIDLPGFIYLTQQKTDMPLPTEFCLKLRQSLNGSFIKNIRQIGSERVIEIEFQKEEKFKLVIELFSKGNLILTDHQNKILALLEKQHWETRELKLQAIYLPPPLSFNYFKADLNELKKKIQQSEKDKLITCLATEIGLGGTYAEEICLLNRLDKNQLPKKMDEEKMILVFNTIKELIKHLEKPQGLVYELKNVVPFPLNLYQNLSQKNFPTFHQALDHLLGKKSYQLEKEKKEALYQEKIQKLQRILKEQEKTLKKLEEQEKLNTQKANYLYEKYQPLNSFLTKIKRAKEKLSWEEIKIELKKYPQVKQINLKDKKVILKV